MPETGNQPVTKRSGEAKIRFRWGARRFTLLLQQGLVLTLSTASLSLHASFDACRFEVSGNAIPDSLHRALRNHGRHTLSYSLLQPGLSYFNHSDGIVAHERRLLKRLVLGDPLADAANTAKVLDGFLQQHRSPFFCGITRHTAELLSTRGFLINELGRDTRIHIPSYTLEGSDKTKLRQAFRKFEREGHRVMDYVESDPDTAAEVAALTAEWRKAKSVSSKEVRFLTRPIHYGYETDTRKFVVKDANGKLEGLYFFDPLYENGKVVGYSTAFKRRLNDAMTGLEEAVMVWAINQFRQEGKTWLNLGLTPLYKVEDADFKHSRSLHHALIAAVRYADGQIYSFRGHADFKHRFRGEEFPVYFATRSEINFHGIAAMMNAIGAKVTPWQNVQIISNLCYNLAFADRGKE